jgi:hypothetical protein
LLDFLIGIITLFFQSCSVEHDKGKVNEGGPFMAKTPANHGKHWTPEEVKSLEKLADPNTPTRVIALKLKRTEDAVKSKASEEEISLKPVNQSPYNRQKKS